MRRHARAAALAAPLLLLAGTAFAQDKPSILERVQSKFAGNEAIRKMATTPPDAYETVKWMVGRWDGTVRVYGTKMESEKVDKVVRTTSFELAGRWLVSRNHGTSPIGEDAVEILGFDAFQRMWRWQFFSSAGRGTNSALTTSQSWDGDRLMLSGTFYIWGESTDVAMRLQKMSDDEYYEVFEEKMPNEGRRPFLEYRYTRAKAGPAAKPAPASKAPSK
jgi:hypothetical protein